MSFLFPPAPTPSLPIEGSDARFPVRRIFCVGQNYAAHAREMGHHERADPFFFTKPADAVVTDGADPLYPTATQNLHHEVELVCAVGPDGALGWAVGCDLTRRDLQAEAKQKGRPWDASKGFDQSAPCAAIHLGALPDPTAVIELRVNGEARQTGCLDDMLWSPDEILTKARELWDVQAGDLIFTGTPEGVGPLVPGDRVEATIGGLPALGFTVKAR